MILAPQNKPPNESARSAFEPLQTNSDVYNGDLIESQSNGPVIVAPRQSSGQAATVPGVVMRRRITSSSEDGNTQNVDEETLEPPTPRPRIGKAFYDYQAKEDDELSFKRGTVVEILDKKCEERGWLHGKINGVEGMVPENYVHLVGREPTEIKNSEFRWFRNEQVGNGGSSRVYKGRWNGREVALKVMKCSESGKDRAAIIEALRREALIYARLSHKNIVRFHGICYEDPACLVLELCKGQTLFSLYRRLLYSVPSIVVHWAMQIARGMEHLHESDTALIHADLKADNVLLKEEPCLCDHDDHNPRPLTPDNYNSDGKCFACHKTALNRLTLKLTDFGLSRMETSEQSGKFEGSVPWMSPELIVSGYHSKKTDVWSFGILIWELVTNRIPHQELGAVTIAAIGFEKITPKIPDDCPKYLSSIMRCCWNLEPKDRPNFKQIIEMLHHAQKEVSDVKQTNNRESLRGIHKPVEEINHLKQLIEHKSIDTSVYACYQPALLPPPSSGVKERHMKQKLTKDSISGPTDFEHRMTVRLADNRQSPSAARNLMHNLLVEYPKNESSRKHSRTGQCNSDGVQTVANSDDLQNSTLPRNYKHSTNGLPCDCDKSNDIALNDFSPINDSNEIDGASHLKPMRFGSTPKAFKSNPELSALFSPPSPLERSNACRKRNIEHVHPSKTEPANLDDCTIEFTTEFPKVTDHLRFRSGTNDSTSLSGRNSGRKKKSSSTFYVSDEGVPAVSINVQDISPSKANKRFMPALVDKLRRLKPSRSQNTSDTGSDSALVCDRPQLPVCIHPNHNKNLSLKQHSHLCGLTDNIHYPQKSLSPRPEIRVDLAQPPNSNSGTRSYLKAADDPLRRRHATSTLPGNVQQTGGRSVSSQVVAQRRQRNESRNSENENSFDQPSSESDIQTLSEPLLSPISQSQRDLRSYDFEQTDSVHPRSRSSDETQEQFAYSKGRQTLPITREDDWAPAANKTYVPMNDSIYDRHYQPPKVENEKSTVRQPILNRPIPRPRTESEHTTSNVHSYENITPRFVTNRPIPPVHTRNYSENSLNHPTHHKKKSVLEQPVVPHKSSEQRYEQASKRNVLSPTITAVDIGEWKIDAKSFDPLINPTYKRHSRDNNLTPPSQPAPLPPSSSAPSIRSVPRSIPISPAQFSKYRSKPSE
ncbi:hypothetical protein M3Y95_00040600 [Aphelenchoides besseyi]|nr:hypothetical protein M3Y95_00040600 [Aphelenchoides besseyi]